MPVLILLIEALAAAYLAFRLKTKLKLGYGRLIYTRQLKDDLLKNIDNRIKYTQEHNQELTNSLELEYNIFDISRELSYWIEEKDILAAFKEKICSVFKINQAIFLPNSSLEELDHSFSVFTVSGAAGRGAWRLAVKDFHKIDKSKMSILINQLELSLKRYSLYSEIQKMAITDSLTGLFARRYFSERIEQELLRSAHNNFNLSFLLIDVDNFKSYNDTYGHITGDAVLKEIAKIVRYSLRQIDMCARFGGEELCAMLPETSKEGALLVAERIRLSAQEAEINVFDEKIKITVSIGISTYPADAGAVNSLIDKADTALYQAKRQGKNQVRAFGIN